MAYITGFTGLGTDGAVDVTYPAGILPGHVMVMAISWKRGIGTTFFVPEGWTLWERTDGSTVTYQVMILTREADGTESGTTQTINNGATQQDIALAGAVYSDVHLVPRSRNVTIANAGGTDTTVECPDPGGNVAGDLRVIMALARGSLNGPSGSPNFPTMPAGFTRRQQATGVGTAEQNAAVCIADGTGTGTVAITASASTYAIGATLWLRPGKAGAHSIFTSQVPSGTNSNESAAYTLAGTWYPTVDGYVTGARWRFPDTLPTGAAGGSVTAGVWEYTSDVAGTLLGTTSFISPTAGTWNTANFSTPIKVTAGKAYVVGIYTPDRYVGTTNGFTGVTITNGYLVAPANGADPVGLGALYNGRLHSGGAGLTWPEASYMGSNYFADVVFVPGALPAPNRLYLTNAAPEYTPATKRGSWSDSAATLACKLGKQPEGDPATAAKAEVSATNPYNVLLGRWISHGALKAGTIAGVMNWCVGVLESNAAANMYFRWHVYVTVGDSDTVRGVLRTEIVNTTEWISTAAVGRTGNSWTMTSTAVQPGDRLVVELGYQAQNAVTTSYTGTINYGSVGAIDLKLADPNVAALPGWVEFTGADGIWFDSAGDLTDTFTTLDLTDKWGNAWSDGGTLPEAVSGRCRIYCNTGYAGITTKPWLHFRDTSVTWEMVTLANGATATTECYFKGSVDSGWGGRYLGFYANLKAGELRAMQGADYWDESAVVVTWNATNHKHLRLREANGTVYYETSPDRSTWTVVRSIPTPWWCTYKNLGIGFDAHRDAGSSDYFEIDNLSIVGQPEGTGTLTASAALASTGRKQIATSPAAVVGTSTLSSAGKRGASGTASATASTGLTAGTAAVGHSGTGSASAAGAATSTGRKGGAGTGTAAGSGGVGAAGGSGHTGTGTTGGTSAVAAGTGAKRGAGTAPVAAAGTVVTTAGRKLANGTTATSATSAVSTGQGAAGKAASGTLGAAGTASGTGRRAGLGTGTLAAATALVGVRGPAGKAGTGTASSPSGVDGDGARFSAGSSSITAASGVTASGGKTKTGTGSSTGAAALSGSGGSARAGTAALSATAEVEGVGVGLTPGDGSLFAVADLAGSGTKHAAAGDASLAASGALAGEGDAPAEDFSGDGALTGVAALGGSGHGARSGTTGLGASADVIFLAGHRTGAGTGALEAASAVLDTDGGKDRIGTGTLTAGTALEAGSGTRTGAGTGTLAAGHTVGGAAGTPGRKGQGVPAVGTSALAPGTGRKGTTGAGQLAAGGSLADVEDPRFGTGALTATAVLTAAGGSRRRVRTLTATTEGARLTTADAGRRLTATDADAGSALTASST